MVKLRKMLTEILLNVTTEEIQFVAEEAYEEEKNKVKFAFKEPKFKPKRPKPAPSILGMKANHAIYGGSLWFASVEFHIHL